jgi:hypothetical protein
MFRNILSTWKYSDSKAQIGLFRSYRVINVVVTDLSLVRFLLQLGELNQRVYVSHVWKSQNIFVGTPVSTINNCKYNMTVHSDRK